MENKWRKLTAGVWFIRWIIHSFTFGGSTIRTCVENVSIKQSIVTAQLRNHKQIEGNHCLPFVSPSCLKSSRKKTGCKRKKKHCVMGRCHWSFGNSNARVVANILSSVASPSSAVFVFGNVSVLLSLMLPWRENLNHCVYTTERHVSARSCWYDLMILNKKIFKNCMCLNVRSSPTHQTSTENNLDSQRQICNVWKTICVVSSFECSGKRSLYFCSLKMHKINVRCKTVYGRQSWNHCEAVKVMKT